MTDQKAFDNITGITLVVSDSDGRPFHLFRQTARALKGSRHERQFRREALSGDYDRMMRTIIKYVHLTSTADLPLDP